MYLFMYWTNKEGIDFDPDTFQSTDKEEGDAQANSETLHELLVSQQNIKSLQERLLELESEQGRIDIWI